MKLQHCAESYITEAQQNVSEASAEVLKKSKIIGATVTGAARRLNSIRAAEPFAVVVEESCEVMEPTLLAVLAVKSLQKLELIGDHRQLPAFIQNCWYNLERSHPSIKLSLFERLVEGKLHPRAASHSLVDCTILDEQRRMRHYIADLTRPHYTDLVQIIDHPKTKIQRVGDKCNDRKQKEDLIQHRTLWSADIGEIPGILYPVYFWNIRNNQEGKPSLVYQHVIILKLMRW
jgi:superfamily I DNA and/or RNA helicase